MSSSTLHKRPRPVRRSSATDPKRAAKSAADPPDPAVLGRGAYVEVASGPAQGARGRVITTEGGSVTLVTTLLGQRPLLLTVASTACATIPSP